MINATRNCLYPEIRFNSTRARELFEHLLCYLHEQDILYLVNYEGTTTARLSRLLKVADTYLQEEYSKRLIYKKPFHSKKKVLLQESINTIKEHLKAPNTAVILSTNEHWIVARKVTNKSIHFSDSDGSSFALIRNITFEEEPNKTHQFIPNSLFLIMVEDV
ncbi:MAG: hypothetical protein KAJ75_05430 [Alphaproteobacteria bacterium]|nr:hypothetical protein [Alphaproteobacteria bacterium]